VTTLKVGTKPLSACAVSPDGKEWIAGTLEGLLTFWDATSHQLLAQFVAHTRPIAAITFSPDGQWLGTASWDRNVSLRRAKDRDGRTISAHADIVSGCRFLPNGRALLSWSYDATMNLWDTESTQLLGTYAGHADRVTAASFTPDGRWIVSGSRDGEIKVWDREQRTELHNYRTSAEIRGCFCLLDGSSVLIVDAQGRIGIFGLPDLEVLAQMHTRLHVQCCDLAPAGDEVALGCEDGGIRFVHIDGIDDQPVIVTAAQSTKRKASAWQKLFGQSSVVRVYACTCPACRHEFEIEKDLPSSVVRCPACGRTLRFSPLTRVLQEQT
jgi:WD40 repeat protein